MATWDVDMIIEYLGESDLLALKQMSQKLALLMALVEASRVSELQALDLRYHVYQPEGVVFQIPTIHIVMTEILPVVDVDGTYLHRNLLYTCMQVAPLSSPVLSLAGWEVVTDNNVGTVSANIPIITFGKHSYFKHSILT